MLIWIARGLALLWCVLSQACTGATIGGYTGDDDDDGRDGGVIDPDSVPWTEVVLTVCGDGTGTYATLGEAISNAPDATTIEVCAGTYAERLVIDQRSVRLVGAGAAVTILDAGGAGPAIVVRGGVALDLEGFTIRGGNTAGSGGGIGCIDAIVDLRASTVTGNAADVSGGGIYGERCVGMIEGTTFTGNTAHEGGALYLRDGDLDIIGGSFSGNTAWRGGALYQASDASIDDATLSGNTAGWTGGAVYVGEHAPQFRRVTVRDNISEWEGGGFYLHNSSAGIFDSTIANNTSKDDGGGLRIFESPVRLERNVISGNRSTEGDGGAFKISHLPGVFIDNQLLDNVAYGAGGGAEFDNDSSQWSGGVISGNSASAGGGIHAMLWPWNGGVIENVRITDNSAWRGGGIYLENHFKPVTIRGVLVEDNHANRGGGIYTRGTPLRLSNSVIVANRADDAGGGFYTAPTADYPWTQMCPCPPVDPAAEASFVVVHANAADNGVGAAVWNRAPNMTFESSIFTGHAGNAVTAVPTGVPAWRYNDTFPATFAGMANPTGSNGNLATDPAFVAPEDFHLTPPSACRDAGDPSELDADGTRADMGAYAGPIPMP